MRILSSTVFPKENIFYANTLDLYVEEPRLGYNAYIFDNSFMHLVRYALSSDCISEFTEEQLKFFMEWVDYNVNLMNDGVAYLDNQAIKAFDYELLTITECIPDPGEIICGNSNLHTYTACP